MSSHGTPGDGQGGGIGDGRGGWASPLGTGLPGPAEIEDVGEGARDGAAARGEGAEGAPSGDGQGGDGVRGAQPQPDPGTGGGEDLAAQVDPGGVTRAPPVAAAGTSEAFLETPRGREMFQDFLAVLARQPAPSEAPDQGGSTATSAASGIAAPITASEARPSLPASVDTSLPLGVPTGGVPRSVPIVTPMEPVPSVPALPSGYVPASALGAPWQGSARMLGVPQPGLAPGPAPMMPGLDFGATAVPVGAARGNPGPVPVQTSVTSTVDAGTAEPGMATSSPALQAFLMDALNEALRMYMSDGSAATSGQTAATMASAPHPTQTGFRPSHPAQGVPTNGPGAAPVFTPSGVPRAAIPSYGGVSINVPGASGTPGLEALPPSAFHLPFQPAMVATPTWGAAVGAAIPQGPYGGRLATTEHSPAQGTYSFGGQRGGYRVPAAAGYQTSSHLVIGIPNELRNAVKVIVPFQSESASSERAAAFWRSFERCTHGMDDQLRLTAFEQCLKGKLGLEWWYNSRIDSFEALRVRFHNRFICQTPAQLWNRLKNAKRNKGESAEEWGDRISTMCDALNYYEPRMRFEFFLEGLRNKQLRAMLNSSMVTSIPEACALLLYKNLRLPVEEEDEFAGDGTALTGTATTDSTQSLMLQQLQQMNVMMTRLQNAGTPNQGQIDAVAPARQPSFPLIGNAGSGPRQIRFAPDTRTTEGEVVCGRCERVGHGREVCTRATGRCNRCGEQGHYSMECSVPKPPGNFRNGERRGTACLLCGDENHTATKCPGLDQLRGLMAVAAAGTETPSAQLQQ